MNGLFSDSFMEWIDVLWSRKTLLLLVCLFGIYLLMTWPNRWRRKLIRTMMATIRRTGLFITETRGKTTVNHYPKLQSVEREETYYILRFELVPGQTTKQFAEKKPFFDSAFNGDVYFAGSGNQLIAKVERIKRERLMP